MNEDLCDFKNILTFEKVLTTSPRNPIQYYFIDISELIYI